MQHDCRIGRPSHRKDLNEIYLLAPLEHVFLIAIPVFEEGLIHRHGDIKSRITGTNNELDLTAFVTRCPVNDVMSIRGDS